MSTQPVYNHLYEPYDVNVLTTEAGQVQFTSDQLFTLRVDEAGTYTYLGDALPGTATSVALWRVRRLTVADNTIEFADGDDSFDNVWDDRASLTYS